jgi:hypothetical protein
MEAQISIASVTAEVASSSLVVPAISFQRVTGCDTRNSNPQFNPQLLANRLIHPHGGLEFTLRDPKALPKPTVSAHE